MSPLLPYLWFLLVLLGSRLILILRDEPLTRPRALLLALVQVAALLAAAPNPWLLPLAGLILAANLAGAWLERAQPARIGLWRLGALGLILAGAGISFAPAHGVAPSPLLLAAGDWLARHVLYFSAPAAGTGAAGPGGGRVLLVLIGALAVMNEANLLIRGVLQLIRVVPRPRAGDGSAAGAQAALILPPRRRGELPQRLDLREYNAGRFIGVLERLLAYAFVLQGQYTAIGLILAAKGFARFREMDERDFAEYVLIGTLLSMTSAVLVAEAVKALLG
jgi:hypothetical protein